MADAGAAAGAAAEASRAQPNILITGTPGTGKSSHAKALAAAAPELSHLDVNAFAKEEDLFSGVDEARGVNILDDDKICDALEPKMASGGVILDTHSMVDYFPERWFDLVVVLRTDNTLLYDRLLKRGYSPAKVQENVQAEIMMVLQEEARSSYDEQMVQVLDSNTPQQLESNISRIVAWLQAWRENNSGSAE